jgi:hypothetical protein
LIRIPIALIGAAAAAWVLTTSRFIHDPEHVKWVIAGIVMVPFIVLAEALARRGRPASARTRTPAPQRPPGYPYRKTDR